MRLIDADAFKEYLQKGTEENADIIPKRLVDTVLDIMEGIMLDIDEQPTIDAVPVVRCKDCVHGTDRTEEFGEGCVNPIACMMYSSDGEPDFFPKDNYCGFGERSNDESINR